MKRVFLVFGIFALASAALGYGLMPAAFFAMGAWSILGFGLLSAVSLGLSNLVEIQTWRLVHPDISGHLFFRFLIRLAIYLGIPALSVYGVATFWPMFLALVSGPMTAIAAAYIVLMAAAILELMPARISKE